MPLLEILKGGVKIASKLLCNFKTIRWDDIVNTETKPVINVQMAKRSPHCMYDD